MGAEPSRALALRVFRFLRDRLPRYKRIRCIEFAELPKTISGKIRRVELPALEASHRSGGARGELEFWEHDFPELSEAPARRG
jgi:acetyl-CoA synthetase